MTREEKVQVVKELVGVFETPGVYLMDFKGLDVAEMTELRQKLRESNVSMRVIKNTLAKRALDEAGIDSLNPYFVGPTGVIWSEEDSITPIRVVLDFIKEHEKGTVKAGLVDGAFVAEDRVEAISKLPTKQELYGQLASMLNMSIVNLARVLNALPTKFVRTVDALKTQKESESDEAA